MFQPARAWWRCPPHLPFWVVICGRPYSSIKLLLITLNTVIWSMWLAFLAALVVDARISLGHAFKHLAVYLLDVVAVSAALIISVCFIGSGIQLICKLKDLRRLLDVAEAYNARLAGAALRDSNGGLGSECDSNDVAHPMAVVVLSAPSGLEESTFAPDSSHPSGSPFPSRQISPDSLLRAGRGSSGRQAEEETFRWNSSVDFNQISRPSSLAGDISSIPRPLSYTSSSVGRGSRSLAMRSSYRATQSRVSCSTITASLALVYDEASVSAPSVDYVISGVRRMLAVVITCVAAFFFRAAVILYCLVTTLNLLDRRMWLPYLLISEVVPYGLLLLFYFIPGCQAIGQGVGNLRHPSPSMTSADESCPAAMP